MGGELDGDEFTDLAPRKPIVPVKPDVELEKVPWMASEAPICEKPLVEVFPSATNGPMLSERMEKVPPERWA